MNFKDASRVLDTIRASDEVELIRGENRSRVISMLNADPPLSGHEAKKMGLRVNVSWGEGTVLGAHARRQYDNATLGTQNYFRFTIPEAPVEYKAKWGLFITQKINRVMKRSKVYACQKEYQAASILSSGIGPMIWRDKESWCPRYVKTCDLRVPTDTKTSLEEVGWFAERHQYTPGELARKVFGKNAVPGWSKEAIRKILHEYRDINYEQTEYTWLTAPEKMADLYRQNGGFYTSDAMPTISLWHFFYQDDEDPMDPCWKMRVVADYGDQGVRGAPDNEFLYTTDKSCAKEISEILNVQFGDFNSDPPFLWYSVRSLGFLLMEPVFFRNLTFCRQLQHLHEAMNILFRVTDPVGRARAQKIQLFDRAILEEGVSIVPAAERHQVDPRLADAVMAQLKQLQGEISVSYTQNVDTGTQKEQTAFETHAKLSSVNAMMSALLGRWARNEVFEGREIGRRFCLRGTSDQQAKDFQEECKQFGIPPEFVNVEQWDIETEMPLGGGNPTMAMAQAQQLMGVRPMLDSTGQQEVLHEFIETVTGGDYKRAERLVPLDKKRDVTDSMAAAEYMFGTMMHGVQVRFKEGLSQTDQIDTLIGLMSGVIARIESQTNLATASELAGLQNVGQFVEQLIQSLSQNPQEKQRVKKYGDTLGKLMNSVKAFEQRLQEQQQSQNGNGHMDPEAQAKFQASMVKAQTDAKIKEAKAAQAQKHKDVGLQREQRRRDASTFGEIQRQKIKTIEEAKTKRYAAFKGSDED